MSWCLSMIKRRQIEESFSKDDLLKILKRYMQHVNYWNISDNLVSKELGDLSSTTGFDLKEVWKLFYNIGLEPGGT